MEIVNRTILDIDHCVLGIETIAMKYLTYPEGVYYVECNREPMTNSKFISHYIKKNKASKTPLHPLYGMYMLRDAFYKYLRESIADGELDGEHLLTGNPLIPNGHKVYEGYFSGMTMEHIVLEYIPDIDSSDLHAIIKDLDYGLKWIKGVSNRNPYAIYNINVSGKHVVIEELIDIRAYRFQEAQEYNEIVKECENGLC